MLFTEKNTFLYLTYLFADLLRDLIGPERQKVRRIQVFVKN